MKSDRGDDDLAAGGVHAVERGHERLDALLVKVLHRGTRIRSEIVPRITGHVGKTARGGSARWHVRRGTLDGLTAIYFEQTEAARAIRNVAHGTQQEQPSSAVLR